MPGNCRKVNKYFNTVKTFKHLKFFRTKTYLKYTKEFKVFTNSVKILKTSLT